MPRIIETLEQEEMWYGQDGLPYRVAEMETSHVTNVLAFLRRRAGDLLRHRVRLEMHRTLGLDEDAWNVAYERWRTELTEDPAAWLERRPLMKALRYELLLRDTVDGEVVESRGELPVGEP